MKHTVLLDLDDTILDFKRAEADAIRQLLRESGLPSDDACVRLYSRINAEEWRRLESGEITRREVLVGRFRKLFKELGVTGDAEAAKERYEHLLSRGAYLLTGAGELLETLSPLYDLFLASNGTKAVQTERLRRAGILKYVRGVFLSECIGAEKPSPLFFDAVFAQVGEERRSDAVMVGDSLTSDIRGGNLAGLPTVWFNPRGNPAPEDPRPTRQIRTLSELPAALADLFGERAGDDHCS